MLINLANLFATRLTTSLAKWQNCIATKAWPRVLFPAQAAPPLASSTRYSARSRGTHTRGTYTRIAGECHQGLTVAALGQCRNCQNPGGSHTFVAMQFCHCTNDQKRGPGFDSWQKPVTTTSVVYSLHSPL